MQPGPLATSCWVSSLAGPTGYSYVSLLGGRQRLGHIVTYEHYVAPIPIGYQVDHLCRVRKCVNPEHLEAVTQQVNIARSGAWSAVSRRLRRCKYGHDTTDAYVTKQGFRQCRICNKNREVARTERHRKARGR